MKLPIRIQHLPAAIGSSVALFSMALGLGLCFTATLAVAAPVATYHSEKRFVATIAAGGVVVGGPGTGQYRYLTHAFAEDKHMGPVHNDNPQTGAVFGDLLTDKLVPGGGVVGAAPRAAVHKWTDWVGFNQAAAGLQIFGPFQRNAASTHPKSEAKVLMDYLRLPPPLGGFAVGRIVVDGKAEIVNLPLHAPETAYAEATSAGEIKIAGLILAADIVAGKKLIPVPVKAGQTSVKAVGGATAVLGPGGIIGARADYHDPMNLAIFDELSGALLTQQDLFTEDWQALGDAGIDYDPATGLRMAASADGSASLSFSTLSGWVLNPFNGTASIANGVFSATGDLAALPWTLSMIGNELVASLSAGDLDLDFDFQVLATGLGSGRDLRAVLSGDARGLAAAYATVPEPSTLLLVSLVSLGLWRPGKARWRLPAARQARSA